MKWCSSLALLGALLLAVSSGCGSEGGVVGSGISSATISGNVVAVDESVPARALMRIPRLAVRLEEGPFEATTDDDGVFEVRGDFSGPLTVRFETLAGRLLARLTVDVPSGSSLELADLRIGPQFPDGIRPGEIRQRDLVGAVAQVDCRLPGFLLDDDVRRPFRVHLLAETQIRLRPTGAVGTCADIRPGLFAHVEGVVVPTDAGPVVEATSVDVGATRPPRGP